MLSTIDTMRILGHTHRKLRDKKIFYSNGNQKKASLAIFI